MKLLSLRMAGVAIAAVLTGLFVLFGAIKFLVSPVRATLDASRVGIPVETVQIPSASGSRLAAWFAAGKTGRGAVVLMHAVRGNRADVAARMSFLHAEGYSVLAFDFQAHGESPGAAITFGKLESHDARAAVAWLRKKLPGEKIAAIGLSLGGAAALLGERPLDVDALVLEAVYPDIRRATQNRLSARIGPLSHVAMPLFLTAGQAIINLNPTELRPIDGLPRFRAPVFIISGTLDWHTPIEETREMFARANAPKFLWEVEGAAHVDLHAFAKQNYESRIREFLDTSLQGSIKRLTAD